MSTLIHQKGNGRGWLIGLIVIAVCSLTFSLATRFSFPPASQFHSARSMEQKTAEPKRQHLNRDASEWATPSDNPAFVEAVVFYPRVILPEVPPQTHVFDESLFYRPPPAFEFIL
jgi:hypothetical protein